MFTGIGQCQRFFFGYVKVYVFIVLMAHNQHPYPANQRIGVNNEDTVIKINIMRGVQVMQFLIHGCHFLILGEYILGQVRVKRVSIRPFLRWKKNLHEFFLQFIK